MDIIDEAQRIIDARLAESIAERPRPPAPRPGGLCAVCGDTIPPARLATGAGTCIECQLAIERGEM